MKILVANKFPAHGGYSWNIFHKGDSCVKEGDPFFIPEFTYNVSASLMFAVKMKRLGKFIDRKFASRYYDVFSFGFNFVAQDFKSYLSALGQNYSLAQNFEKSCAFGTWSSVSDINNVALFHNGNEVVNLNNIGVDIFATIDEIIEYSSKYYTIKIGDVICFDFGNIDIENISINDLLRVDLNSNAILTLKIK